MQSSRGFSILRCQDEYFKAMFARSKNQCREMHGEQSIKIIGKKSIYWGWDESKEMIRVMEIKGQCSPLITPYPSVLPFLVWMTF